MRREGNITGACYGEGADCRGLEVTFILGRGLRTRGWGERRLEGKPLTAEFPGVEEQEIRGRAPGGT